VTIPLGKAGDKGDNLTIILTTFPSTGRLLNTDGSPLNRDSPIVKDPSGNVQYVPDKTTSGPSSFSYKIVDNSNSLTSAPAVVLMQLSPSQTSEGVPLVRYTDPVWKLVSNGSNANTARREASFSVTATDSNNDPLSIVFTYIPDVANGTVNYRGKSIGQEYDPRCDCIIIPANATQDGSSGWNFLYQATNPTGMDKVTFQVVDRQINSAADLAKYPSYSIVLDANQAGKYSANGKGDGNGGDGSSSGGLSPFWIAFIVIVCIICCLLCITCIILAIVLIRKRTSNGRGLRRRNARKPLNDQQYENLGSYSPPDL